MVASCICKILVPVAMVSWAVIGSAQAALVISSKPTHNVSCSAGVCTATAKSAVVNVGDLTSMLASEDVTLISSSHAKDIDSKVAFSWSSTHRLTLDSYQSIAVEKLVTVAGSGALTLTTNDGGTGGMLSFTAPGRVAFWDLSSSLDINGASYTLVGDIATLASDIASNPSGRYALANNYDASADGTYVSSPIPTTFTGSFEGKCDFRPRHPRQPREDADRSVRFDRNRCCGRKLRSRECHYSRKLRIRCRRTCFREFRLDRQRVCEGKCSRRKSR